MNHYLIDRIRPRVRSVFVWVFLMAAMISVPGYGQALLGTYAQNSVMVADGSTVYTAWVFVDNRPLDGTPTWGTEHTFILPTWMTLIDGGLGTAYGQPDAQDDFFEGRPMVFEMLSGPGEASGRLVSPAYMAVNKLGTLEYYKFTVNPDAAIGAGSFDIGSGAMLTSAAGAAQSYDELNVVFKITRLPGDISLDDFVGLSDLDMILTNWNADTGIFNPPVGDSNGDGFVGLDDLDWVLANWNAGSPPSTSVPEPSGVALLFLTASALCRRRGG